ncbi:MAG: hypothetical protein ACNI27_16655 [Desulfovibrio sp.]
MTRFQALFFSFGFFFFGVNSAFELVFRNAKYPVECTLILFVGGVVLYLYGIGMIKKDTPKKKIVIGRWSYLSASFLLSSIAFYSHGGLTFMGVLLPSVVQSLLLIMALICLLRFLLYWNIKIFKIAYEIIVGLFCVMRDEWSDAPTVKKTEDETTKKSDNS